MCRSEPHTPARVSFTRMAPGSTSGTGYSRSSNSPPYARSTAIRPFITSLLLSWPARLEHDGVQGNSHGTIAKLGGDRCSRRPLDLVERFRAAVHDGAQDPSAFAEGARRSLRCRA